MIRSLWERFAAKFGTAGAVLAAAACPVCFPKIALVGAAFGLGALAPFEGYFALGVQVLFVLALTGHVVAYGRHRNRWLLALAIAASVGLFAGFYAAASSILLQLSVAGLVAASVWLALELRRCAVCASRPPEPGTGEPHAKAR